MDKFQDEYTLPNLSPNKKKQYKIGNWKQQDEGVSMESQL